MFINPCADHLSVIFVVNLIFEHSIKSIMGGFQYNEKTSQIKSLLNASLKINLCTETGVIFSRRRPNDICLQS